MIIDNMEELVPNSRRNISNPQLEFNKIMMLATVLIALIGFIYFFDTGFEIFDSFVDNISETLDETKDVSFDYILLIKGAVFIFIMFIVVALCVLLWKKRHLL